MNIFVGGVNGVGKSTILRRVTQIDKRFEVIHLASGIMQQLGLAPGSYDALRDTPSKAQSAATTIMMQALVSRKTQQVRLIDGHYSYLIEGTQRSATDTWIKLLDAYVLVTAAPEVIWRRINSDEVLRDRDLFTADSSDAAKQAQLAQFIKVDETDFEALAKAHQKDHFVLTHNDDDVDRAAKQLINFCDTVKT